MWSDSHIYSRLHGQTDGTTMLTEQAAGNISWRWCEDCNLSGIAQLFKVSLDCYMLHEIQQKWVRLLSSWQNCASGTAVVATSDVNPIFCAWHIVNCWPFQHDCVWCDRVLFKLFSSCGEAKREIKIVVAELSAMTMMVFALLSVCLLKWWPLILHQCAHDVGVSGQQSSCTWLAM